MLEGWSKTEKVGGAVAAGLILFVGYELLFGKTASASQMGPSPAPMPQPSGGGVAPANVPPVTQAAAAQASAAAETGNFPPPPLPGGTIILPPPPGQPTTSGGPTSFTVTTSGAVGDPLSRLKVRAGPGLSFPMISWLMKNQAVQASGVQSPADGYSWAQVYDPNNTSQLLGWAATAFLTPSA